MSFLTELEEYTDVNGFVGPGPCKGHGRTCDNHLMFSAEAYLTLTQNPNPGNLLRVVMLCDLVHKVTFPSGWFSRYPGDPGWDLTPDNLLGYLTLCYKEQAQALLEHLSLYDGMITITYDKEGWLCWRQPQLYFAMLAVAGRLSRFNPIHIALAIWTALVIMVSGLGVDPHHDQDARRLSYLLIRVVSPKSILSRLAAKIWWKRLRQQYGDEGMRLVYFRYFGIPHPISKYSRNDWEIHAS